MPTAIQAEVTGAELRSERRALSLSIASVARAWGCTSTNVQLVEGAARVTPARASRYRAAVAAAGAPELPPSPMLGEALREAPAFVALANLARDES